jgi:hypothetical protein
LKDIVTDLIDVVDIEVEDAVEEIVEYMGWQEVDKIEERKEPEGIDETILIEKEPEHLEKEEPSRLFEKEEPIEDEEIKEEEEELKEGMKKESEFKWDERIDYRYFDEEKPWYIPKREIEYGLLNELEEDDWVEYLDVMAGSGVTVEYDSVDDHFVVKGPSYEAYGVESKKAEKLPDAYFLDLANKVVLGEITYDEGIKEIESKIEVPDDLEEALLKFDMAMEDMDEILSEGIKPKEAFKICAQKLEEKRLDYLAEVNMYVIKGFKDSGYSDKEIKEIIEKRLVISKTEAKSIFEKINDKLDVSKKVV